MEGLITQAYLASSLSIGLLILGVIISLYFSNKNRLVLYYILFQTAFVIHVFFYLIYFYISLGIIPSGDRSVMSIILAVACDITSIAFFILIPFLITSVISVDHKGKLSFPFLLVFLVNFGVIFLYNTLFHASPAFNLLRRIFYSLSLLCAAGYASFQLIRNKNKIIQPLKGYSIILAVVTLLFTPLILIYDFLALSAQLFSPLLFMISNILGVFYFFKYSLNFASHFQHPEPPALFYRQFQITQREQEIIEELLQGASYKDMTEKLFISINTVKKHVNNIYKKVGVKNKIELLRVSQKFRGSSDITQK